MKTNHILYVDPQKLNPSPFNPRRDFTHQPDWPEFLQSVGTRGVEVPLLVRPLTAAKNNQDQYEIVAGHRRWTAALTAKLKTIPVIEQDLDDGHARELQAIENLQRADLLPLEEAKSYADWRDVLLRDKSVTTVEAAVSYIASKVGRKRSAVFQKLSLLKAAKPIQDALASGRLEPSAAALIAGIPSPEAQAQCLKQNGDLSVRELAEVIAEEFRRPLAGAPFDPADATLVPLQRNSVHDPEPRRLGGACTDCPHRSGNMADRYPELTKSPNICTLPACFEAKTQAQTNRVLNQAKARGRPVLDAKTYDRIEYRCSKTNERCYDSAEGKLWSALAAKAGVVATVAVDERGAALEVFTPDQKEKILKANKITRYAGGMSARDKAEQKKRQAKEKKFTAAAGGATNQLLGRLIFQTNDTDMPYFPKNSVWFILAQCAFETVGAARIDFVAKRRGLSKSFNDSEGALRKWMRDKSRTPLDHARLVLELTVCSAWNGGYWHTTSWAPTFKALCALTGKGPEDLAKLDATQTSRPDRSATPKTKPQPKRKARK